MILGKLISWLRPEHEDDAPQAPTVDWYLEQDKVLIETNGYLKYPMVKELFNVLDSSKVRQEVFLFGVFRLDHIERTDDFVALAYMPEFRELIGLDRLELVGKVDRAIALLVKEKLAEKLKALT